MLLAAEDAVSISFGHCCVFSWPSTFGLQSRLFLECSGPFPLALPRDPAPTTPSPSLFSTDFSWLGGHPLNYSRSMHPPLLPLVQPHRGSAIIMEKALYCHSGFGSVPGHCRLFPAFRALIPLRSIPELIHSSKRDGKLGDQELRFGVAQTQVWTLTPPFISCVILSKLFSLFVLICKMGINKSSNPVGLEWGIKERFHESFVGMKMSEWRQPGGCLTLPKLGLEINQKTPPICWKGPSGRNGCFQGKAINLCHIAPP